MLLIDTSIFELVTLPYYRKQVWLLELSQQNLASVRQTDQLMHEAYFSRTL